ncbi:MAG: hypothetical protein ACXAC6_15115 [Candidatus Hodarchaeales archaeon]
MLEGNVSSSEPSLSFPPLQPNIVINTTNKPPPTESFPILGLSEILSRGKGVNAWSA